MKNSSARLAIIFTFYLFAALITGCADSTYKRVFDHPAYTTVEQAAVFKHLVVEHYAVENSDELHIYIEGDGLPWIGSRPSSDPTPANPVALALMSQDKANAIYLGRPCYFNHYAGGADARCAVRYWTSARYASEIIDDMVTIALRYVEKIKPQKIVIVGYSGGGVLATMMACSLPKPVTLITLAANLDVAQWTALHTYSPLSLSLNPIDDFIPCAGLSQHHYAGADDRQVPVKVTRAFTEKFNAPLTLIESIDHRCCWAEQWPALLKRWIVSPRETTGIPWLAD